MYRPIVKLNTNVCKVCMKVFANEKSMKDHIFSRRVNYEEHTKFKNEIIFARFGNAKLECPVWRNKIFRILQNIPNGELIQL